MKFSWALGVELAGVTLAIACSLMPLPVVSTKTGQVTTILWGPQPSDNCPCTNDHTVGLTPASAGSSSPDEWDFDFTGPTVPAGPGPYGGETVEVDYADTSQGWIVLSVITEPGLPDSATYVTPAGIQFKRDQSLHYAALAGLVVGLVMSGVGAVLVYRTARRLGARAGAVAAAAAPVSLFAIVPVIGLSLGAPALAITTQLAALVWIVASIAALAAGVAGRREQPSEFARRALVFVSVTNGIWIVWWIGGSLSALGRAMY